MTSVSAAYPLDFTTAMHDLLGAEAPDFFAAQARRPPVSLRLNPHKIQRVLDRPLPSEFIPVPWSSQGLYLQDRPCFTLDPRFHGGAYYVQDASCMLLEAVLRQLPEWTEAERVLDLCGAPGGKSTLLKAHLPEQACLISNEVVPARAQILAENLTKWGADRVLVTRSQPRDFQALKQGFDVIVVDAPCSGEGLFRRQPEAIQEWSPDQVQVCARRQADILHDIWPTLEEGGLLIYSTCTWNRQENEELLDSLQNQLSFERVDLQFPEAWGIHANDSIYRCLPHRLEGEGFSVCVLRKTEARTANDALSRTDTASRHKKKDKKQRSAKPAAVPTEVQNWCMSAEQANLLNHGEHICHWPVAHQALWQEVSAHLRVVQGPLEVAHLKGKQWLPSLPWLLSSIFEPTPFAMIELTLSQALQYLYGEALPLEVSHLATPTGQHKTTVQSESTPSAWQWVSFAGIPLGWVKATPTHYNNYWPKNWKIRQRFEGVDPETNLRQCLPEDAIGPAHRL